MSIPITQDALARLRNLGRDRKFSEDPYYPGAPTEEIRSACERRVNDFIADMIIVLERGTERDDLFARAKTLCATFDDEDTEEREKVGDYIGDAMRIIGLEDWTEHV